MKNHRSRLVLMAALGALTLGLGLGSPASAGNARSDRTEIQYRRWLQKQAVLNAQWRQRMEQLRERLPQIRQQGQQNWARWTRMGRPVLVQPMGPAAQAAATSPLPADPQPPEETDDAPDEER